MRTILGKDPLVYLHEQFPASVGHIPLSDFLAETANEIAELESDVARIREVLLNLHDAALYIQGYAPLVLEEAIAAAKVEIERTKEAV